MKKILAIVHDIHAEITDETIYETLNEHYGECHFETVRFDDMSIEHGDQSELTWLTWKNEQSAYYSEVIKPKIDEDSNRQIVYFGLAPIPLCIHLGFLIGAQRGVDVFQKLHEEEENWKWLNNDEEEIKLSIGKLPETVSRSKEDTVIRIGTFAKIDPNSTQKNVENTAFEVDINAENSDVDYFRSLQQINAGANDFFSVLNKLNETFPEMGSTHLFAAVPCGFAFLMGKKIQPNVHKNVVTYHYHARQEPKYSEAFVIQEKSEQEIIIPENELQNIAEIKKELEAHYRQSIEWFVSENTENEHDNWFLSILPKKVDTPMTHFPWNSLSKVGDTMLADARFSSTPLDEDETKFFVDDKWYFPNWLIYRLTQTFELEDLKTAMRLFWFHEGIHYTDHQINSDNSESLGRYARVLEEADYQSDVYALFCEFGIKKENAFRREVDFFAERIEILIRTLQAFDGKDPAARMQTRRVNRYLIWYFQLARIKHSKCKSIDDIIDILSIKPHIDLKLPIKLHERNKIFYQLSGFNLDEIGIAFFHNNKVQSFGPNGSQFNLIKLVEGLRTKNSESVMEVMRQALPTLL